jgi:hypothetical protein
MKENQQFKENPKTIIVNKQVNLNNKKNKNDQLDNQPTMIQICCNQKRRIFTNIKSNKSTARRGIICPKVL